MTCRPGESRRLEIVWSIACRHVESKHLQEKPPEVHRQMPDYDFFLNYLGALGATFGANTLRAVALIFSAAV